jgi:hypothetical protein
MGQLLKLPGARGSTTKYRTASEGPVLMHLGTYCHTLIAYKQKFKSKGFTDRTRDELEPVYHTAINSCLHLCQASGGNNANN